MTEVDIILPRKNFDITISETFDDGITGIFGPSGSGKTSLLQAIAGLAVPKSGYINAGGRVLLDSRNRINVPVEKRRVGYVFQEGRLFPHMTVEKNILYGYKKDAGNGVRFNEVVKLLNLGHLLKSRPWQISGGERQRTALGRSLLSSPDILLLDEPFSAVDTRLRSQILPFIIKIQQKIRIPILVVSHDMPDLLKLTNKLCIIKEGCCLGYGEYYDLLKIKQALEITGAGTLVNAVNMKVTLTGEGSGMTILEWEENGHKVEVKCGKSSGAYTKGQELKIFIHADDIALSTKRLTDVTIQNQLKGIVTDIIGCGSTMLCIVDAGFRLVVEITAESCRNMNIEKGGTVWCLFKSVAIDITG